ncbi:MAG: protein BatD [Magnetococcales bacterium]|nr:protein BatD [Magnetococcales bacterium]
MVNWQKKQRGWQKIYLSLWTVLLCLILVITVAQAAEITVQVDQSRVLANESFKLIFETKGSVDGEPDFSPLKKDFDILSQNQSSSFQFINGEGRRSTSWILNLIPKETGKFTIPAIKFGSSSSKPVTLLVSNDPAPATKKSQLDSDMFLLLEADTKKPYVQAQVVITLRFYRAINIASGTMTKPDFSGGEVVVESLGKGRQYDTKRHDRTYRVEEYRYLMFPQKSGKLTLKPIRLTAQIGGTNQVFGNLFNDPFGRQRSSTKRISSNSLSFDVQAIPQIFHNKRWLPAHEVIISQKWSQDPSQFIVDEPITRTINLMADGIPAKQLPKIVKHETPGLKQYTDKADFSDQEELTGIVGVLQQKNAIIPTTPGKYKLAAIEIPWWDVDEDKLKIARLKEEVFTVQPAINNNQTHTAQPQPIQQAVNAPTTQPQTTIIDNTTDSQKIPQAYLWLSLFFGCGWFLTVLAWWLHYRSWQKNITDGFSKAPKKTDKNILKQLKTSSLDNRPTETRRLLLQWANEIWPDLNNPSMAKIRNLVQPTLREELEKLEQTLFAKEPQPWNGAKLWQEIKAFKKGNDKGRGKEQNGQLSPLY